MKKLLFPPPVATKTVYTIWKQIVKLIPPQIVLEAATETKILSRTFTPWSHLLALIYQQLTRTESLNGVCDAAAAFECEWGRMRGAQIPRRNTFSNANRKRDPKMAELVFWRMFDYLKGLCPDFASCKYKGFLSRFKERAIHALDSSTIQLTLNCFDWARHRRQKAAAKLHMNLDLGNRLPSFAIVEEASHHDSVRAEATTANLKCGDILVADRAYTDFKFLCSLAMRGVFYVVRWKRNIKLETVQELPVEMPEAGKRSEAKVRVLKDEIVKPAMPGTAKSYSCDGGVLRCVTAEVEYDGKMLEMSFLTNNLEWSARTIAELYRARWGIETFFKELKQTCQIRDFIGYNENAVKWQVWTGLLVHMLLRYLRHISKWKHSFSRLAGVVRACAWLRRNVVELLESFGANGTARGGIRVVEVARPLYLQAFLPFDAGPVGQNG